MQASYLGAAPVTLSGVAPKAYVLSYRVFYNSITNDGSFYNTEGIKALEDIVMDGADVLNNSWGGGPGSLGGEFDALDTALINAVKAGIFVSMSNGNAGPGKGTGDHPSADYINVAATTTTGTYAAGRLKVTAPEPVPADLTSMAYGTAQFGAPLPVGSLLGPYSYVPAEVVAPANIEGCSAFPAGAFDGKAALIRRGTCNFSLKVLNAQDAGASFVVIYNQAAAGNTLTNMAAGTGAAQVTISSVLIGNTNGTNLVNWYTTNGDAAQLALDTVAYQAGNTPDIVANFSSRGPGVGNVLKPDIAAPGVNILSQGFAPGVTGEARHLGFGQASGTSMAAPHVTGAAALLKQIHPSWSPAWIKSALMSTSKYLDMYNDDGTPAQPLDMGAGRLDLTHAANPGVILDPPSLSFGLVEMGETKSLDVTITSTGDQGCQDLRDGMGFGSLTTVDGMTVSPANSITLCSGRQDGHALVTCTRLAGRRARATTRATSCWMAPRAMHMPGPGCGHLQARRPFSRPTRRSKSKDYSVIAAGELAAGGIQPVVLDTAPRCSTRRAPAIRSSIPRRMHRQWTSRRRAARCCSAMSRSRKRRTVHSPPAQRAGGARRRHRHHRPGPPGHQLRGGDDTAGLQAGRPGRQGLEAADGHRPDLLAGARVRAVHSVVDAPAVSIFVNDGLAFFVA